MKPKSPGISILIAMSLALFASMLVLGTMLSVGRSFDQSLQVGRSLELYYASEGALEAALFHKNIRGEGVDLSAESELQSLLVGDEKLKVQWTVSTKGRDLVGLIKPQKNLDIRLSIPQTQTLDMPPQPASIPLTQDFTLTLYENSSQMPQEAQDRFHETFGEIDITDFPFQSVATDEPFMRWSAQRLGPHGYELFRPEGNEYGFICKSLLEAGEIQFRGCKSEIEGFENIHALSSQDTGTGSYQQPTLGLFESGKSFAEFLALTDENYSQRKIIISPIGAFTKDPTDQSPAPARISGIPYHLSFDHPDSEAFFEAPESQITVQVQDSLGLGMEARIKVDHRHTSQDFNYIMFD